LSGLTSDPHQPALNALVVERERLGTDPETFIRVLRDCPGQVPVILLDGEAAPSPREYGLLLAGYAAVLHPPINPTLLFNALRASLSRTELPDNVVSLAQHFQSRSGGQLRLRVLVAEDNATNQQVLRGMLERAGHEVFITRDGAETLATLESPTVQFDLAILDMHMPGLSGLDVVRRWRFLEQGRLPIVMLTADATERAQRACREAGADAFLTKPVNSRNLMDTIVRVVAQRPAEVQSVPVPGARPALVLDEGVLQELAETAGGVDFIRELIQGFRADAENSFAEARQALEAQDHQRWCDQLHVLKGTAIDVGANALVNVCLEAERTKPFELGRPLAQDRLTLVRGALDAASAALDDYLARQRNAQGL
jgi:two-component system sensor histidine kinase RpfC